MTRCLGAMMKVCMNSTQAMYKLFAKKILIVEIASSNSANGAYTQTMCKSTVFAGLIKVKHNHSLSDFGMVPYSVLMQPPISGAFASRTLSYSSSFENFDVLRHTAFLQFSDQNMLWWLVTVVTLTTWTDTSASIHTTAWSRGESTTHCC